MKCDINVIRPRSIGYSTCDNMDSSNVPASPDVAGSSIVFVDETEQYCNVSQCNVSENWEDAKTMAGGNDSSNSASSISSSSSSSSLSSSSYVTCSADVDLLPDFDALLGQHLQSPVSLSDIDPLMDENDVLMRTYCREMEKNNIYRMINACESLETMEEYVINQLSFERDLEAGKFFWFYKVIIRPI